MTRATCHVSISLDGFIAGPDQSRENPIGIDGLPYNAPIFVLTHYPREPVEVIPSPHATHIRYRVSEPD